MIVALSSPVRIISTCVAASAGATAVLIYDGQLKSISWLLFASRLAGTIKRYGQLASETTYGAR